MRKGVTIWLTGLPCSGKTTIAFEIEKYFKKRGFPVQRLDGDVVRETLSKDLGFSKEDRDKNIERISYVAQMLVNNGVNVVVAFVSPYRKMRDFARGICPNFCEVYVKCNVEECMKRDVKGMYKKALNGEIKDFTGVQDPYEEPEYPDVVVDTREHSLEDCVKQVIVGLEEKKSEWALDALIN